MTQTSGFLCGRILRDAGNINNFLPLADLVKVSDEEFRFITGVESELARKKWNQRASIMTDAVQFMGSYQAIQIMEDGTVVWM